MNAILSLFLFLMPLQATSPEEMYKDYITPEVQAVLDEADRIAEESREAEESARNKKTLALVFSLAVGLIPVVHIGVHVQNPVLRIERKCVPLCVEPKVYKYVIRSLQRSDSDGPSECAVGLL